MPSKFFVILVVVAVAVPAIAQSDDDPVWVAWSDITTIYRFGDRFRYDGDQGIRGTVSNADWRLAYIRPSVRWDVKPWFRIRGGVVYTYVFADAPEDAVELRPWLGLKLLWPRPAGVDFSHYFRLEQRYLTTTGSDAWLDLLRLRYQLQVKSPDFSVVGDQDVYALASIEFFGIVGGDITARFVTRVRYDGGIGVRVSRGWRFEAHYLQQRFQLEEGGGFHTYDHIVRLRLFYAFN